MFECRTKRSQKNKSERKKQTNQQKTGKDDEEKQPGNILTIEDANNHK